MENFEEFFVSRVRSRFFDGIFGFLLGSEEFLLLEGFGVRVELEEDSFVLERVFFLGEGFWI